jgi:integrase
LFLKFLGSRADVRIESLTTDDFLRFRDALLGEGRSTRTVNFVVRKVLKRSFAVAVNEGILNRNPIAAVRHLREEKAEKGVFNPEQVIKLLSVADLEWRGMILAGYFTGARLANLARLKWENVSLAERSLTFVQEKTDAKIRIPIHPELFDYMESLAAPTDKAQPLFPSLYDLAGTGRKGLSMRFQTIMREAGIDPGTARERPGKRGVRMSRLSFHSFRHSLISNLANAGVPAEVRKLISGHADDRSHEGYTHTQLETVRRSLERIPRLSEK